MLPVSTVLPEGLIKKRHDNRLPVLVLYLQIIPREYASPNSRKVGDVYLLIGINRVQCLGFDSDDKII